jgi:predicted DsbA family dithiol-disulfide isomerase
MILFSDFTCPFSYVMEAALRRILLAGSGRIEQRAFELYPAPTPLPASATQGEWLAALRPLADEAGARLEPRDFLPRTRKAHEAAHFARQHEREPALRAAIFRAYWEEGRDIGRIDVLVALAGEVGLVPEELKIALDIDAFADEVVHDRTTAAELGIQQTPTLIVGSAADAILVVGTHPISELRALIEQAEPGATAGS